MTIPELKSQFQDTEEYHKHINDLFCQLVDNDNTLKQHRDFVENGYGFGERAFWWLWKLICDEQKQGFSFLELGVYKSATLSLIKLLRPDATVHGVSPLSSEGGYPDCNYWQCIQDLHGHFNLDMPAIIKGLSNENWIVERVKEMGKWDVIYVDGSHKYSDVLFDLSTYAPLVKSGGYLVMDDANVDLNLWWGAFRGHQEVTDAKLKWLETQTDFEFVCSVVHISVFKKK